MQDSAALRQEIEALRALADAGMDEHAPPANALAREKLLQLYRARQAATHHLDIESPLLTRAELLSAAASGNLDDVINSMAYDSEMPWNDQDYEALEWLCRLDEAGHARAARLVRRALDEAPRHTNKYAGRRLEALAAKFPKIALAMALREYKEVEALTHWLRLAGEEGSGIAAVIEELDDWPIVRDTSVLWAHVHRARVGGASIERRSGKQAQADFLAEVAESRIFGRTREKCPEAWRLVDRAAELGSKQAIEMLWEEGHAHSPDKVAYVRDWLATLPSPDDAGRIPCMRAGAAIDKGETGRAPDASGALRWYAAALRRRGGFRHPPSLDSGDTCFRVASALDGEIVDEAALALAWYERGIALGSLPCVSRWISACIDGELGLAPDPDAAMQRLNQCIVSGADREFPARSVVNAIRRKGMSHFASDPASGMQWFKIAALLGDPTACDFLSQLYERGRHVTRDSAAARFWLEKAAALGDEDAQAKLSGAATGRDASVP